MHKIVTLAVLAGAVATVSAQQVWSGFDFAFSKADFVDPLLAENQDRITDDVWITRGDFQGLFNAAQEDFFGGGSSPAGTRWAFGNAVDFASLDFQGWGGWVQQNPPGTIGRDAVVHLIDDDIYIDIRFTGWTVAGGGGFSYVRAVPTPGALAIMGMGGVVMTRRRR